MVSAILLAVAGGIALVGVLVLWRASREFRTVYHVLTNDPVPIRDLPTRSGPVEIEGTGRPTDEHGTVHSPFTDSDCLAFEYETQEYQSSGQGGHWKTLDEGGARVPFLVADDTGLVRVDPDGAELHFEEHSLKVPGGQEPPARIAEYVDETDDVDPQTRTLDLVVTELNYGNDQKFVERRLDVGEDVYVYGNVDRAPGGERAVSPGSAIDSTGDLKASPSDRCRADDDRAEPATETGVPAARGLYSASGSYFATAGSSCGSAVTRRSGRRRGRRLSAGEASSSAGDAGSRSVLGRIREAGSDSPGRFTFTEPVRNRSSSPAPPGRSRRRFVPETRETTTG